MTYARVTASDDGTGGGPTDLTVILDALADGALTRQVNALIRLTTAALSDTAGT